MNNVIFSESEITTCQNQQIEQLKLLALSHPQKCARFCLHQDNTAKIQQMLLVMHKDCRFMPHKHPKGKSESIQLIEGRLGFSFFDDEGKVYQQQLLEPGGQFLIRLEGDIWHLPIALSEWAVFHEIYTGPYDKENDVTQVPWMESSPVLLDKLYTDLFNNFRVAL